MIDLRKINLDMTREDIIRLLGQPDAKGGTSRKYKTPRVFKYGNIEFHFLPWKSGTLAFVQEVDNKFNQKRILLK
jgi:hypothetical protein